MERKMTFRDLKELCDPIEDEEIECGFAVILEPIIDNGVIIGIAEFHECECGEIELAQIHSAELNAELEDIVYDNGFRDNAFWNQD